jgi:hypothetical protein
MDKEDLYEQYNEDPSLFIDKQKLKKDNSLYGKKKIISDSEIISTKEQVERHQIERQYSKSHPEAIWKSRNARIEVESARIEAENTRIKAEKAMLEDLRLAKIEAQRLINEKSRCANIEANRISEQLRLDQQRLASSSGTGCILPVVFVAAFSALLVLLTQLI